MSFDEKHLNELLISIDSTSIRIKRISNYMMFFRNESVEKILEIWKNQFECAGVEKKMLFIYVANEIVHQSAKKAKFEFVKAFGDQLIDCFSQIIRTDSIDIMTKLVKLCNLWESDLIYANHFMEFLRNKVHQRIKSLSSFESGHLNEDKMSEINLISKFPVCKNNLCLDLQEDNLKNIYDYTDKDKLHRLLSNITDPDSNAFNEVSEYEEKLKELKQILMTDLVKRENFIISVSEIIAREKNDFFSNENQFFYKK